MRTLTSFCNSPHFGAAKQYWRLKLSHSQKLWMIDWDSCLIRFNRFDETLDFLFVGGKGFAKVVTPSPSKNICGFRSWSNSKSLHAKCHTQGHIHTVTRLFSLILSRITLSLTFMESIDNVVYRSAKLFIKDSMQ